MSDTLISLRQVSKSYFRSRIEINIFDHIDLEMRKGDFYAVMGPSGSGKTTLLNLLSGVDSIDSGEYWFGGERVDRLKEHQLSVWRSRNVAFVFQSFNLLDVLTAAQNVELPLLLAGISRQDRKARIADALSLVGLDDRGKHLPSELSGGQQQRLAIARAVVADTVLLLCDEPTGNLDRESTDEVLDMLRVLNREFGKTIVLVTHDPAAAGHATETLFLNKGKFTLRPS